MSRVRTTTAGGIVPTLGKELFWSLVSTQRYEGEHGEMWHLGLQHAFEACPYVVSKTRH